VPVSQLCETTPGVEDGAVIVTIGQTPSSFHRPVEGDVQALRCVVVACLDRVVGSLDSIEVALRILACRPWLRIEAAGIALTVDVGDLAGCRDLTDASKQ
jgi:hypothetical protein